MNKSIFLARAMGLFLLILCSSLLVNVNKLIPAITTIFDNTGLQFILGMILLIIGILLVLSHNIWKFSWVVVITILSWLIFIKGIIYLMFPAFLQVVSHQLTLSTTGIYAACLANILIGLYLCYMGFFATNKK